MSGFYRRALSKKDKLTAEQCRELLAGACADITRLETVLDSLPFGILVCDEKHCLIQANKSALRLLPVSSPEGGPLWDLISDDHTSGFFSGILQSGLKIVEHEIDVNMQGHNRLLSISVHPLVEKRRITGSLIYIEDITEKRGREVRLRRAENLASLTTLAASVAHEIKNPLGAISIHLQLMQKTLQKNNIADDTTGKYINILNEEVDRLNRIVVDFLFAVRPMSLELREGNINDLITDMADFIRAELEQSGIRLFLELDETIQGTLIDERFMKQALLNLIKNAQAAMNGGGLLTIATMGSDSEVLIKICDTGVGISEENLKKIFEPYFTTRDNGTGLGLTIMYKIIREHQGDVSVDSQEGEGTDIEISLPVYQKKPNLITYKKPVENGVEK